MTLSYDTDFCWGVDVILILTTSSIFNILIQKYSIIDGMFNIVLIHLFKSIEISLLSVSFFEHDTPMYINPLECKGSYRLIVSATSNMNLVHWPLTGDIWYSLPRPLLAIPNVNSQPINGQHTPITVLLYNDPLLCGFNVPLTELNWLCSPYVL